MFVSKLGGNTNPQYDCSDLNLCIALYASGKQRGYGYVTYKLGQISICHARIIFEKNRIYPLINTTMEETVENMCNDVLIT